MTYILRITRDEATIAELEVSADRAIDLLAASVASEPPAPRAAAKPERKSSKKEATGNAKWQALEAKAPSQRLSPEKKQQIENLLIEGISVAEIVEQMKVSNPTVYVIKTRLKKEGRL